MTYTDRTTSKTGVGHVHGLTAGDRQYATKADIDALKKLIADLTERVQWLEFVVCPQKKP